MVSLHSSVECVQLVCWDLLAAETLALGQLCFCCWAGRSNFFFFLHYETHSTDPTNAEVSRVGWFFFLVLPKQCQGGRADPAQERGLGAGLGWAQPKNSLEHARGSPAGTAVGQRSTNLPFSVKDPAHQVLCVQLFKGISVNGHSYSKLQESRVRGSWAGVNHTGIHQHTSCT